MMDCTETRRPDTLGDKIASARLAQNVWAALPYADRAWHLRKSFRYLGSHIDELVGTIRRENGKLPMDALAAEAVPAMMALDYYLRRGRRFCKSVPVRGGNPLLSHKKSRIHYGPCGVVGIISPWNYPFAIPFSEAVMALLAGNAVFLKVASLTPGVGRFLASVFEAADLPRGLFNHLEMPGGEAGRAFVEGGLDKLFFTGSTATGRELMALAAPRLLPLVLELGGADAAIVCGDADLDRAALGLVWGAFSNAGQSCGGVQRILVNRRVYQPFLEKFSALTGGLRPGVDLGPMSTAKQKEAVSRQIEACLAGGALIAARSREPDVRAPGAGLFLPATVLVNAGPETPVMAEEIFGPVAAVLPVDDDGEALRIANSSPYGLTGSVWSGSPLRARRLAAGINAGAVMINDHLMSHGLAETPWGGFGWSGIGRTHGESGFREMQKARVVVDDALPWARKNPWWHPYSEKAFRGMRAMAEFIGGGSLAARLRSVPAVAGFFLRCWEKPSAPTAGGEGKAGGSRE